MSSSSPIGSGPHDAEQSAEHVGSVAHDQIDHEAEGADRDDAQSGDHHDFRVFVGGGLACHLEDATVLPFPEALHPLLDPTLYVPALVHDVRHVPHRTMSTPPWGRTCSPGPRICFDRTPVRMSMTLSLCSRLGSTAAPQMIRAFAAIRPWTFSPTFSASETLMSSPPVTFTRAPVAALMSTSIRGELMASSIDSSARLSVSDSPRPIIATPPPFMIVLMSLKSRFTRPGFVMTSVIPLMARMSTSSATLNAAFNARRGTSSRSLSFGITTTWGRAPAPRPRVTRRPRSNLCGDRMMRRCWASVFAAYSSAPTMPDSTRRSIVLQPPPPIPTILMFVRRLARIRSSSASSAPTPIDWVGDSGTRVSAPDRVTISLTMESIVRPPGISLSAGE